MSEKRQEELRCKACELELAQPYERALEHVLVRFQHREYSKPQVHDHFRSLMLQFYLVHSHCRVESQLLTKHYYVTVFIYSHPVERYLLTASFITNIY